VAKTKEQSSKTVSSEGLRFDFSESPVIYDFFQSNAFVQGVMGPVGSGKSYGCAAKIFKKAIQQKPSPIDNIRYSRWAVVRNSYPMLKTTTIKTWLDLFPESTFGPMMHTPPITHHIRLPARGEAAGIDMEVIFLALDQSQKTLESCCRLSSLVRGSTKRESCPRR